MYHHPFIHTYIIICAELWSIQGNPELADDRLLYGIVAWNDRQDRVMHIPGCIIIREFALQEIAFMLSNI